MLLIAVTYLFMIGAVVLLFIVPIWLLVLYIRYLIVRARCRRTLQGRKHWWEF